MPSPRILLCTAILVTVACTALAQKSGQGTRVIFLPDLVRNSVTIGDTTWSCEYYDKYLHKISVQSLKNTDEISEIRYYKSYRAPFHTTGLIPFEYELVYRYAQVDAGIWARSNPETKGLQRYQVFKEKSQATDTIGVLDPLTRKPRTTIFRYCKTALISVNK